MMNKEDIMRIAVIGADIFGLTTAYLLSREHNIVVFEANDYIGGHTQSHEHFNELGSAHTEKRHAAFAGNCFGQHGFSGSRRTYQQCSARHLATQFRIFSRLLMSPY